MNSEFLDGLRRLLVRLEDGMVTARFAEFYYTDDDGEMKRFRVGPIPTSCLPNLQFYSDGVGVDE